MQYIKVVLFYVQCWKHRNEEHNDSEKQQIRHVKWCEELSKHAEDKEPPQVKMFVKRNKINIEHCQTETIKKWVRQLSFNLSHNFSAFYVYSA